MGYKLSAMREEILKQFFLGQIQRPQLWADVRYSVRQLNPLDSDVEINDMEGSFQVCRLHLITLCDAIADASLPSEALVPIGFALMASDTFEWDDEVISEVIADWSCPEVNYPLNTATVERCKRWLTGEEPLPRRPALETRQQQNHPISVRRKRGG